MPSIASPATGPANVAQVQRYSAGIRHDKRYYQGRAALGLAIAAGHLALLWLALMITQTTSGPMRREGVLTAIDMTKRDKPATSTKPVKPVKLVKTLRITKILPIIVVPAPEAAAQPAAAAGAGAGEDCRTAEAIAKGISENPDAMAAVAALPKDVRSDSDAVMLWNGTWLDSGETSMLSVLPTSLLPTSLDPVAALKQVVLVTLAEVPAVCRDLDMTGPQFIPIAEPTRTTMLVIGSGLWRWSSLLEPVVDPLALPSDIDPANNNQRATAPAGN